MLSSPAKAARPAVTNSGGSCGVSAGPTAIRVIGSVSAKIATPSRPSQSPRVSSSRAGQGRAGLGQAMPPVSTLCTSTEAVHSARSDHPPLANAAAQPMFDSPASPMPGAPCHALARGGQHLTEQLAARLPNASAPGCWRRRAPALGARMRPTPRGQPDHGGGRLRPARAGPGRGARPARLFVRAAGRWIRPGAARAARRRRARRCRCQRHHADPRHVPAARRPAMPGLGTLPVEWLDPACSPARCAK